MSNTDEGPGDENFVKINNVPGSHLMVETKVVFDKELDEKTATKLVFDETCEPREESEKGPNDELGGVVSNEPTMKLMRKFI